MRILVADDDREIVDLLKIYLKNEGYSVETARSGDAVMKKIDDEIHFDLIVMDIMMPGMSGLEVLEAIRQRDISVPVVLVSAKSQDHEKIEGLLAGADDYVTKPFNPLEVTARIKSILRRQYNYSEMDASNPVIHAGPLTIKRLSHEVFNEAGESISLTSLEFGILYLLASNPSRVFSAEEIFKEVWEEEEVIGAKTVMVHMSHLRDKIAQATGGDKVIQTVWGVGYKVER